MTSQEQAMQIAERSVQAQESTIKLVETMKEHNKQMNDNFILHCNTENDTNKTVHLLTDEIRTHFFKWGWYIIKAFVIVSSIAILSLMGITQIPKILAMF